MGGDENGQESGCGGCGEDHFGKPYLAKIGSTPTCVRSMSLARGTPTNFLGGEAFAMTYMQRRLRYCGKRSSQPVSLKDLGYMEFVLVESKLWVIRGVFSEVGMGRRTLDKFGSDRLS